MKVVNLDQIDTRKSKVVVLGGKEHVMKSLTVREYINQLKEGQKIEALIKDEANVADNTAAIFSLTIEALAKVFPSITREQFEALTLDQLTAIRELVEYDESLEELDKSEIPEVGEETGKTV